MARRRPSALVHRPSDDEVAEQVSRHAEHSAQAELFEGDEHLRLSEIRHLPVSDLKPSKYNVVFEPLKDESYYSQLRHDIVSVGKIMEPLIVQEDGTVLSGHSRLKVAAELLDSGNEQFGRVPVRIVQNNLNEEQIEKRVYRLNLTRFEIDPDTRILIHAELYPDYYKPERLPQYTAEDAERNTAESVAKDSGLSKRQVGNERSLYQQALAEARGQDKDRPSAEDIARVRHRTNEARRGGVSENQNQSKKSKPEKKSGSARGTTGEITSPIKDPIRTISRVHTKYRNDPHVDSAAKDHVNGFVEMLLSEFASPPQQKR